MALSMGCEKWASGSTRAMTAEASGPGTPSERGGWSTDNCNHFCNRTFCQTPTEAIMRPVLSEVQTDLCQRKWQLPAVVISGHATLWIRRLQVRALPRQPKTSSPLTAPIIHLWV